MYISWVRSQTDMYIRFLIFSSLFLIFFCFNNIYAQDPDLENFKKKYQQRQAEFSQKDKTKYEEFKAQQEQQLESFKIEVEQRWRDFKTSTQKKFVRYSESLDSRSEVDFESGTIELEVQIDEPNNKDASKEAEKKILEVAPCEYQIKTL